MVAAQIVRLILANEWGVTTEFWHFDFSAYLKHSTYGIMGSYRTFVHYVRKKKKKIPIGVIRPKIRVKNEISRFLKFLSCSSTSRLSPVDPSPGSSSGNIPLLRAYFRSSGDKREVYELDPPLLGPQPRILGRSIWAVALSLPGSLMKQTSLFILILSKD